MLSNRFTNILPLILFIGIFFLAFQKNVSAACSGSGSYTHVHKTCAWDASNYPYCDDFIHNATHNSSCGGSACERDSVVSQNCTAGSRQGDGCNIGGDTTLLTTGESCTGDTGGNPPPPQSGEADLIIASFNVPSGNRGQSVTATGNIKNDGDKTIATDFSLGIAMNGTKYTDCSHYTDGIETYHAGPPENKTVGPGVTKPFSIGVQLPGGGGGPHKAMAMVDHKCSITESDKNNNYLLTPYNINPRLQILGSGDGNGKVTDQQSGGINCTITAGNTSVNCSKDVSYKGDIKIIGDESAGSSWGGFTGGGCTQNPSSQKNCTVNMDRDKEVTAHFFKLAAPTPTPAPPTVDLKVKKQGAANSTYTDGPLSINNNDDITFQWTVDNATACDASGDASGIWSGSKASGDGSHTEDLNNLTANKTYTIRCTRGSLSDSDSVTVNVAAAPTPTPETPQLSCAALSTSSIKFSWTPTTTGTNNDGWLQVNPNSCSRKTDDTLRSADTFNAWTDTPKTLTGLNDNATYCGQVSATGGKPWSSIVSCTTTANIPTPTPGCVDTSPPPVPTGDTLSCSYDTTTGGTKYYRVTYLWNNVSDNGCAGLDQYPYWSQISTGSSFSTVPDWYNSWSSATSRTSTGTSGRFTSSTTIYSHVRSRDAKDNQSSWSSTKSKVVNDANCGVTPPPGMPNLVVEQVQTLKGSVVTNQFQSGDQVKIKVVVRNAGDVKTPRGFNVGFYKNQATQPSGRTIDERFSQASCPTLDPDQTCSPIASFSPASSANCSNCFAAGFVDYNNQISEADETDNFASTAYTIGTGITQPPATATPPLVPAGPWIKLKDASFWGVGGLDNPIPSSIKKYDRDDTNERLFVITSEDNDPGAVVAYRQIDLGGANASSSNWQAEDERPLNSLFQSQTYNEYTRSRKEFVTITNINRPQGGKINIFNGSGTLDDNGFPNEPFVLIVTERVTINKTNFNPGGKVFALLADSIIFDQSVQETNGIFVANTIDTGETNQGLKVTGNLIAKQSLTNKRQWTGADVGKPSLFIIFDVKQYLDLLPYLSVAAYDWKQLQ